MLNKEMLLVTKKNNYLPDDEAHVSIFCAKENNFIGYNKKGLGTINRTPYWSSSNFKTMQLTEFESKGEVLYLTFIGAVSNLPTSWTSSMTININGTFEFTAELTKYNIFTIYGRALDVSLDFYLEQDIDVYFTPAPTGYL